MGFTPSWAELEGNIHGKQTKFDTEITLLCISYQCSFNTESLQLKINHVYHPCQQLTLWGKPMITILGVNKMKLTK